MAGQEGHCSELLLLWWARRGIEVNCCCYGGPGGALKWTVVVMVGQEGH